MEEEVVEEVGLEDLEAEEKVVAGVEAVEGRDVVVAEGRVEAEVEEEPETADRCQGKRTTVEELSGEAF